jgi:ribosomal protein S18 acetylase RimI-like enzyme
VLTIRRAEAADLETLHELYRAFFDEQTPPEYYGVELERELAEVDEIRESGMAFVAEEEGSIVGFALARRRDGTRGLLSDIYVRPEARRKGVATALAVAATDALKVTGATHVTLSVDPANAAARAAYAAWGFRDQALTLVAEIGELAYRLGEVTEAGPTFGSVHVQTDDIGGVTRAVAQFIPRLAGHSQGSFVSPPRNGWIAVYDEACERDHDLLRRLGRELSDRMGAVTLTIGLERGELVRYLLYERGRMVDEYLSVPEHYGPLAPGDAVALGANPTVVGRLTGADPREVRAIARVAASPADLPPAGELLAQLAVAMKIEGAEHGYAEAGEIPDVVRI